MEAPLIASLKVTVSMLPVGTARAPLAGAVALTVVVLGVPELGGLFQRPHPGNAANKLKIKVPTSTAFHASNLFLKFPFK